MDEFLKFKEDGNQLFKDGKYEEAVSCYIKSLNLLKEDNNDKAAVLKNLAACNLKLNKYQAAVQNASNALEISPNDPKALFRRCQAYENLDKIEDAHKDAMKLFSIEPKNTAIQPVLRRLNIMIQDKAKENTTTESKVNRMFNLVFDEKSGDKEKRLQAANNLIVLAREDAGAAIIFQNNGLERLAKMLEEKDAEINLVAIRVLSCLCSQNRQRATTVLSGMTIFKICLAISSQNEQISTASAHLLRNIITAISDLDSYKKDREKHETLRRKDPGLKLRPFPPIQLDDEAKSLIDQILRAAVQMLNQAKVSAVGRDNVMELLLKLVTRTEGVAWTRTLLDTTDALSRLLEVAGTIKEHKTLPITDNSRQHASLVLSRIYDDTMSDKEREMFLKQCTDYLVDLFGDDIMESKLEAITAVSALLQGPFAVGNSVLSREGVLEVILALAQDGVLLHQKIAVEALVLSASKKDKCSGIIKQAVPILKELYQNANDEIKVRALVGLCKLGSVGGTDTSAKTFADGSNTTLAKACRKFLSNPAKDVDLRKWAAEGLAYLTLDADVKEELVNDEVALRSLTDLAKHSDKSILYPVATVFVNVTNSYDKPDIEPEMKELAKFSKQHIPEEHEKDKQEFVDERIKKLVKAGVVTALTHLSKSDSNNSRELLCRVFLAVCMEVDYRGVVVAQGGAKALIPLANENTDLGKAIASQALAKIAITTNPEIAFPGQRACEVVRPILQLLHIEKTALQNYEALLALTNLASMNDTLRKRILKEKGFPSLEHYMFEQHEYLRRGAVECMCNLVMCEETLPLFQADNDRIKLLVLYCGEEDEGLVKAAAGTLAMLSQDAKICHKIVSSTKQWCEIIQTLAANENTDIQYRGLFILLNLMSADKEIAHKMVESQLLEILMAISKLGGPEKAKARQCAEQALAQAVEYGFIKAAA